MIIIFKFEGYLGGGETLVTRFSQYLNEKDIDDILCQNNYLKLLDFKKENALERLAQAKIISEQKRQVLMECTKKTTALEKLKDKQFADFKAAEDYKESEFIDDLATSRFREINN